MQEVNFVFGRMYVDVDGVGGNIEAEISEGMSAFRQKRSVDICQRLPHCGTIDQSVGSIESHALIDQSINNSIGQSINRLISQSISQSSNPLVRSINNESDLLLMKSKRIIRFDS